MADKAKGGVRAVRHLASVVFQQNDALCGDLLVQRNFILNQSIQRIKTGLAVLHVDAFGFGLAVVDAAALQAQNALHTACIGRDQHIGRDDTARQRNAQYTGNSGFDDFADRLIAFLFLCHNCFLLVFSCITRVHAFCPERVRSFIWRYCIIEVFSRVIFCANCHFGSIIRKNFKKPPKIHGAIAEKPASKIVHLAK